MAMGRLMGNLPILLRVSSISLEVRGGFGSLQQFCCGNLLHQRALQQVVFSGSKIHGSLRQR